MEGMRAMAIETINEQDSGGRPYVPGLVVNGELIFVSGQVPVRDGTVVGTTIEEQTEAVLGVSKPSFAALERRSPTW